MYIYIYTHTYIRPRGILCRSGRVSRPFTISLKVPSPPMDESRNKHEQVMSHIWMSHVTHVNSSEACEKSVDYLAEKFVFACGWVMSLICERVMSHMWMRHVIPVNKSFHTCGWVTSHVSVDYFVENFVFACGWVMSHMWTIRVTHVDESCRTCERVMPHVWMSHVTRIRWLIRWKFRLCLWMSHVTHMSESCHTCGWVEGYEDKVCHTHECVMPHVWMSYVSHIRWLICWKVTNLLNTNYRDGVPSLSADVSSVSKTWLIHMCDTDHLNMQHESYMYETLMRHVSYTHALMSETCLINACMRHASLMRATCMRHASLI